MSETESSSAEAPEAEVELDVEANAQVEDQSTDTEAEDQAEDAEPEDDAEEVDYEGQKFRVPKVLKDALLRQADYTQKTQALANERKVLESRQAEINQRAEVQAQTFDQRVQLAQLDAALEQYTSLDWSSYVAQYGSDAAVTAQAQWRQLEQAKAALQKDITDKEAGFVREREQVSANVLREANEVLSREVEGYGEPLVAEVVKTASAYGFTPDDIRESFLGADGKADIRTFKLLSRLATLERDYASAKAKEQKAQTAQKVASIKPAVTVKPNAGQYKPGLSDDLPVEEWNRRRLAQIAKR